MPAGQTDNRKWSGRTGGTVWMQQSLVKMMRHVDLRIFYGIMAVVVPFYMLFAHAGYIAAYRFFRKRMNYGVAKSFLNVYLNHFRFGQIILDRFAVYAGKTFEAEIEGREILESKVAEGKGVIQLGSHVGNYELAGYSLSVPGCSINAVVFSGETETVMQNRAAVLAMHDMRLIPIREDLSHLLKINAALEKKQIVSIHGDRMIGHAKCISCPFFGSDADFPAGPYTLAQRRNVPLLAVFAMKESTERYRIFVYDITAEAKSDPEKYGNGAASLAKAFAAKLENIVKTYPEQWFNYYDFWNESRK